MPRGSFDALSGALAQKPPADGGGMAQPVMHEETRPGYEKNKEQIEDEQQQIAQQLQQVQTQLQSGPGGGMEAISQAKILIQKYKANEQLLQGMGGRMEDITKEHLGRDKASAEADITIRQQATPDILKGR